MALPRHCHLFRKSNIALWAGWLHFIKDGIVVCRCWANTRRLSDPGFSPEGLHAVHMDATLVDCYAGQSQRYARLKTTGTQHGLTSLLAETTSWGGRVFNAVSEMATDYQSPACLQWWLPAWSEWSVCFGSRMRLVFPYKLEQTFI